MSKSKCYAGTFLALLAAAGCGGDGMDGKDGKDGKSVEPSIGIVQPAHAYLGRRATVQIGGVGTHFAAGKTQVDFGDPNIRVEGVNVAGPGLLQVDIQVGPADPAAQDTIARIAPHDIRITTAGEPAETVVAEKVFDIEPPITAAAQDAGAAPAAPLQQGGLARIVLINADERNPFYASVPGPEITIQDPGVTIMTRTVTAGRIVLTLAADLKAGRAPFLSVRNPDGTSFVLPAGLEGRSLLIGERGASDLLLGEAVEGKLTKANDSVLYRLKVPAEEQVLSFTFPQAAPNAPQPEVSLLPESGKWKEALHVRRSEQSPAIAVVPGGATLHAVLRDRTLQGTYAFKVTAQSAAPRALEVSMPPTSPYQPDRQVNLSQGAAYLKQVAMPVQGQKHYYEFTVATAGWVHALTGLSGQALGAPVLDVLDGACASGRPLARGTGVNPAASFEAQANRTYCVSIGRPDNAAAPYSLLITR